MAVEHLVRTLLAIALVIIAISIVKKPAEAAFKSVFGGNLEDSFKEFVAEANNFQAKSKQVFVKLEKNTAIIGFSSTAKEFKCFGCGIETTDITSSIAKPENEQCKNKPCVCLCKSGLKFNKRSNSQYEMRCDRLSCETLKKDLFEIIGHEKYIEELQRREQIDYSALKNAKWEGGFLFERHSREDFISNGLPQKQGAIFTVFITQESTNQGIYVAVCPSEECSYSLKLEQKTQNLPADICQIMYACFKKENTGYQKDIPPLFGGPKCRYNWPVTGQRNKEDCEKVQACANSKLAGPIPSKCEDYGGYYQLTFLP